MKRILKGLYFNNLKIRNKLLLLYATCVLLPIILTDVIIMYNVNNNARDSRMKDLEHVMERVEYNLNEIVGGCIQFTNNPYTDPLLNRFLNRQYNNNVDYYESYVEISEYNSLSYNYNFGLLYKIQVIADNNTLLSGGSIATLDSVKQMEWYKAFKESGKEIFLYTYYDEAKKFIPTSGSCRTISIIRNLNNFGRNGIEKLLKIDIDYNAMLRDVANEKMEGEIYVRNSEYILFTNLPNTSGMKPYPESNSLYGKEVTMSSKFMTGGQEWEVLILSENEPFWSVVFENKGLLILILLNIIIPTILIYYVGKSITQRLSLVAAYMGKVEREQFESISVEEGSDEIGKLIHSYNLMVAKIKELIEVVFKGNAEKQALELSNKQAELKAIQSQVNPHFLFNTLETIRMRSFIKGENETADIIGELALLFRSSMTWGADLITIKEEINFIEKYIKIQKYRFGDKVEFHHYIMEECNSFLIPKLSVSTFIENAFVHGIETSAELGIISLNITRDEELLRIKISDNGKGFGEDRLKEIRYMIDHADIRMLNEAISTGMLNSYLRLKLFCDGNISFRIDSRPENGTEISIVIPIRYIEIQ